MTFKSETHSVAGQSIGRSQLELGHPNPASLQQSPVQIDWPADRRESRPVAVTAPTAGCDRPETPDHAARDSAHFRRLPASLDLALNEIGSQWGAVQHPPSADVRACPRARDEACADSRHNWPNSSARSQPRSRSRQSCLPRQTSSDSAGDEDDAK